MQIFDKQTARLKFTPNISPLLLEEDLLPNLNCQVFQENRHSFHLTLSEEPRVVNGRVAFVDAARMSSRPIAVLKLEIPPLGGFLDLFETEYYKTQVSLRELSNELGRDWVSLAKVLCIPDKEIDKIKGSSLSQSQQCEKMIRFWYNRGKKTASGIPFLKGNFPTCFIIKLF